MHVPVFGALIVWYCLLALGLTVYAVTSRRTVHRALALEALTLVLLAALAALAIVKSSAAYLDIALVVAMLASAQTIGTVRLAERRGRFR